MGYCPQDVTLIENVNKLLPAHYLVLDHLKTLRIESYWSLSSFFNTTETIAREEAPQRLETLLKSAIEQRMIGKQKVGCFLSGGLGSASVSWFLSEKEKNSNASRPFLKGKTKKIFKLLINLVKRWNAL